MGQSLVNFDSTASQLGNLGGSKKNFYFIVNRATKVVNILV